MYFEVNSDIGNRNSTHTICFMAVTGGRIWAYNTTLMQFASEMLTQCNFINVHEYDAFSFIYTNRRIFKNERSRKKRSNSGEGGFEEHPQNTLMIAACIMRKETQLRQPRKEPQISSVARY